MKLIDVHCGECDHIWEDTETTSCPKCRSHNVRRVWKANNIQLITNHASCVEHVIQHNRNRMEALYEEDAARGSEAMKLMQELSR